MMGRFGEFFENEVGALSMTRLLCFISIFPASYVVVIKPDPDTLAWYIGGYVLGYVGGKASDVFSNKPAAQSLNVKAAGDINVS